MLRVLSNGHKHNTSCVLGLAVCASLVTWCSYPSGCSLFSRTTDRAHGAHTTHRSRELLNMRLFLRHACFFALMFSYAMSLQQTIYPRLIASSKFRSIASSSVSSETERDSPSAETSITDYYKRMEAEQKASNDAKEALAPRKLLTKSVESLNGRVAMSAWAVILLRYVVFGVSIGDQFGQLIAALTTFRM